MAGPVIHALSSGPPPSGVAIIRLTGTGSLSIAQTLLHGQSPPPPRLAMLRSIFAANGEQCLDRALVLLFPAPASFTGEDSVELHLHGSPAVVAAVQSELSRLGSRPAEPGEFTRRAFESGRLDLTQAEALADLLTAETEIQRRQAIANTDGRLRDRVEHWRDRLILLMADVEADLDFADEPDVGTPGSTVAIERLAIEIEEALAGAPLAERVRNGLAIAIVGPPNAGKSSLLNALARRDIAIVTSIPGTTRDLIEVPVTLAGRPAILIDTAGLRQTDDPVEMEGIARARRRAASADLVLDLGSGLEADSDRLEIVSRIDEHGTPPGLRNGMAYVSATTGDGLAELEAWLADWATRRIPAGEPSLVTTHRQAGLLQSAAGELRAAVLEADPILIAERLRQAADALARLTGRVSPEEVLGAIFDRFCIGK